MGNLSPNRLGAPGDGPLAAEASASSCIAAAARYRAQAIEIAVQDAISRAHLQVETALARTTTAAAQLTLAQHTFELARVELGAGRLTTVSFFQARRDFADAAANHVSAVAELALARHLLRLTASPGSL